MPNRQMQTLTLPKPLVEFANRPMILHQVESLAAAGVTDIVLAVNYRPDMMVSALKKVRSASGNSTLHCCNEQTLTTMRLHSMRSNMVSKSNSPSSLNL